MSNISSLALFLAVAYLIAVIPGVILLWYFRKRSRMPQPRLAICAAIIASLLVSPALVVGHTPLVLPFVVSILIRNNPDWLVLNAVTAAFVFGGTFSMYRKTNAL